MESIDDQATTVSGSRLNDEDFLRFLVDGYLIVEPTSLTCSDHDHLYQAASTLYEQVRVNKSPTAHLDTLGDALLAQIPVLNQLLADPAVTNVITSILGEDYLLHPHHFVHKSGFADQGFHQDGNLPWNERGHYRSHRPDMLILFYYPQRVDLTNGPTEIVPGSQYWTHDIETGRDDWTRGDSLDADFATEVSSANDLEFRDNRLQQALDNFGVPDLKRQFIQVPQGSVVIGNYDLIHRGSRTRTKTPERFMYKFYFARTREPDSASWNNTRVAADLQHVREELKPIVEHIWHWCRGERLTRRCRTIKQLADDLLHGREDQKVAAAYGLGAASDPAAIDCLIKGLYSTIESTRRASAYGLRASADVAIDALIEVCAADLPSTRRFATFALGNSTTAGSEAAIAALIERLKDSDDLVRSNAAYALGQISRSKDQQPTRVFNALVDRLEDGVEPDNTNVAMLPRSTVRQSAAYGLTQYVYNHALDPSQSARLLRHTSADKDRYVRGMLLAAIEHQASAKTSAVQSATQSGR